MPSKCLIIETYFNKRQQNFYYMMLPDVTEDGFYRSVMSYSAFFSSMRTPKANVTEVRQFTSDHEDEIKHRRDFFKNVDFDNLKTFGSIWEFYDFIGYDYKKREYRSGEVMKRWNGTHYVSRKVKK